MLLKSDARPDPAAARALAERLQRHPGRDRTAHRGSVAMLTAVLWIAAGDDQRGRARLASIKSIPDDAFILDPALAAARLWVERHGPEDLREQVDLGLAALLVEREQDGTKRRQEYIYFSDIINSRHPRRSIAFINSAILYLRQTEKNVIPLLFYSFQSLGRIYLKLQKFDQAIYYLNKSISLNDHVGVHLHMRIDSLRLKAEALLYFGQFELSLAAFSNAISLLDKILGTNNLDQLVADCLIGRSIVYVNIGLFKSAIDDIDYTIDFIKK